MTKRRPTRDDIAIDQLTDMAGMDWLVAEYRPTTHGFNVAIGWPVDMAGPGNPRAIMTEALMDYLVTTARPRDIDLPLARSTVNRLRRDIGLRWDWDAWWTARADDLRTLSLADFCARHGGSIGAASQRRQALTNAD